MRKTITIPGAGETRNIGVSGRSFIIENIPAYEKPEDVPLIAFNPGGNENPIYPRNVYSNNGQYFNDLIITGTAESEGDELNIFVTDECLETRFNIVLSEQYKSVPGTTFTKTADDTVKSLTELELIDSEGNLPAKLYVTVSPTAGASGTGIKWAINADPVQGDDTRGNPLSPDGTILELKDIAWILAFRFIAETNTENAIVNFTPEY